MSAIHAHAPAPFPLRARQVHRVWRAGLASVALCLAASNSVFGQQEGVAQHLPIERLQAGMYNIDAEQARTPQEREIGLMFRRQLGDHTGMLFTFEQPAVQCFWMHNTPLPLTAAFIADDGSIVNLVDMAPQTDSNHCSTKPVRYVLEMAQGWFAKAGLKPGSKITGRPFDRPD